MQNKRKPLMPETENQARQYDLIHDCLGHQNVQKIYAPYIQGSQRNVLLADTATQTYVFKFSACPELAQKNVKISEIYKSNNIPVPETIMHTHNQTVAEVYPRIPGCTMHEFMELGVTKSETYAIYAEILYYFEQMAKIDISKMPRSPFDTPYQLAKTQLHNINDGILPRVVPQIVRILNIGRKSDIGLYNFGITPKNVILDNYGHVTAFIDMDEIGVCDKHYAFGVMAYNAANHGISAGQLCEMYKRQSGDALNPIRIQMVAQLNQFGRTLLWKNMCRYAH